MHSSLNSNTSNIQFRGNYLASKKDAEKKKELLEFEKNIEKLPPDEKQQAFNWTYNKYSLRVANKIYANDILYNNKNVKKCFGNILFNTFESETQEARCGIIDKLLSDERIYTNEKIMDKAGEIILLTISKNVMMAKCEVMDKFLNNQDFYDENIDNAGDLVKFAYITSKFSSKIIVTLDNIKRFFSNLF